MFFKHFGTSGIESWDTEMAEMARTHIYAEELNRRNGQGKNHLWKPGQPGG